MYLLPFIQPRLGWCVCHIALMIAGQRLACADVAVSPLFTPHAVLQHGVPISVWGTSTPGENIAVTLENETVQTTAGPEGRWRVMLSSREQPARNVSLRIEGKNTVTVSPIHIGVVLVAAGGVAWKPVGPANAVPSDDIAVFTGSTGASFLTETEMAGRWSTVPRQSSALAYALASRLAKKTGFPVGVIVLCSDAALESWIPEGILAGVPAAKPILNYFAAQGLQQQVESAETEYEQRLLEWVRKGQTLPLEPESRPQPIAPPKKHGDAPSVTYNAMLAPLSGMEVHAMIWDHGEDDDSTVRAVQYGNLLPAALEGFRRTFGHADLPVTIVQRRSSRNRLYDDRAGAELREGQWKAQNFPLTATVPTLDLGQDPPPEKVADRIAAVMIGQLDNNPSVLCPELAESRIRDHQAILAFTRTGGGLETRGPSPLGLMIYDGRRWVWADTRMLGDKLLVTAPGIESIKSVRYAWQDRPERGANLYGKNGLPVFPFRTETSRLTTAGTVEPGQFPRYSLLSELYVEDPHLPRVLLIGDSIAIGQVPSMRDVLKGKANVLVGNHYGGGGMYTTTAALKNKTLAKFLEEMGPFDVIQFNMGVHEFSSDLNPQQGSKGYAGRLSMVVDVFREHAPQARLIWCSSTGTWGDGVIDRFPKYLTASRVYNEAAANVMKQKGVAISDLFAYTQPEVEKYIGQDKIHLRNEVKVEVSLFLSGNILPHLPPPR